MQNRLLACLDANGQLSFVAILHHELMRFGRPPAEQTVNAYLGYVGRTYRIPASYSASWRACYVQVAMPHQPRGGVEVGAALARRGIVDALVRALLRRQVERPSRRR